MLKGSRTVIVSGACALVIASLFIGRYTTADAPAAQLINIIYPKNQSAVGRRVNVVIDPTTDWAALPFFQVIAGSREYPLVDTSTTRHAVQGVLLEPGLNTITVRGLAPVSATTGDAGREKGEKPKLTVIATKSITVYNREETFGASQAGYEPKLFHNRDQEAECSGCHRLEAEKQDLNPSRREEVLCFACHREMTNEKHLHGPAALWNCLSCHDPELYPVKYQFVTVNPWTISKTKQPVAPMLFSFSADDLFKPLTAVLVSDDVPALPKPTKKKGIEKKQLDELAKAREEEVKKRKTRERELFIGLLEYLKQNPADKLRVEAHVDDTVLSQLQGKNKATKKDHALARKKVKTLTESRARAIARLLNSYGIKGANRIIAVGMGNDLPKAQNTSKDARQVNNRIEIVAHPPDVQVQNSLKLPLLKDRLRITVTVAYGEKGPEARNVKFVEPLLAGVQYIKGSAVVSGVVKDPQVNNDELRWQLGDAAPSFQKSISFILMKSDASDVPVSPVVRLAYTAGKNEETRDIDPLKPDKGGLSVREVCEKWVGSKVGSSFGSVCS